MGIENFEKTKKSNVIEVEFQKAEKENIVDMKNLFEENAKLSLLLVNGEVNMTPHQVQYYLNQLGKLREEIRDTRHGLQSDIESIKNAA